MGLSLVVETVAYVVCMVICSRWYGRAYFMDVLQPLYNYVLPIGMSHIDVRSCGLGSRTVVELKPNFPPTSKQSSATVLVANGRPSLYSRYCVSPALETTYRVN